MRLGRLRQVLIVLAVLLAVASPMIAPVLAQENNSTGAGGNGTDTGIADPTASNSTPGGNSSGNSSNNSSGNNSYTGPYQDASGRAQEIRENQSSGSSGEGEQAYGSGYLSDVTGNATNNNGTVQYGNNSSGNGSGMNGSTDGLSSDADGIKGTGINIILDGFARILKFISNAIGGAMTFILKKVIGAMTWTPHPPRNNSYQAAINASNSTFWGQQYHTYDTVWRPFALFGAVALTVLYAAGNRQALNFLPANVQQKGWLHLGLAWIMCTDASWVLISMVLDGAGLATQALLQTVNIEVGAIASSALVIVALLLYYLIGFWMVLAMMFIYGMRIVFMIALTPAIPMLFVARAIPIKTISEMADSLLRFWGYLAILPIPVVAVLAMGFGMDLESMLSNTGLLGSLGVGFLGLAVQTGTILAAIVLPYILYQRTSGSSTVAGLVGAVSNDDMKESYDDQEEDVRNRREKAQIDLPDKVQNMAVKARNVYINGFPGGGGGGGGGGGPPPGGPGSPSRKPDPIYVESETRRSQLEEKRDR